MADDAETEDDDGTAEALERDLLIAGHEVRLELDDAVLSQGGRVSGRLIVVPEGDRDPGQLSIRMRELWLQTQRDAASETLTTRSRARTHEKQVLKRFDLQTVVRKRAYSVQLEKARSYPFSFQLPRNARISTDTTGWQLAVTLRNDLNIHPDTEFVRLEVRLAEECRAVLDAWESRLKFEEERERRRWDARATSTQFRLRPPSVLTSELDAVLLRLRQGDRGGVVAEVTFDLAEKSVADYFKALVNGDKVTREVTLDDADVLDDDGDPNHFRLTTTFSRLLNETLAAR